MFSRFWIVARIRRNFEPSLQKGIFEKKKKFQVISLIFASILRTVCIIIRFPSSFHPFTEIVVLIGLRPLTIYAIWGLYGR